MTPVPDDDDGVFKRHQKVVATEDLPGVPAGPPGRVVFTNGLTWVRYRVRFENGKELNLLDAKYLAPAGKRKDDGAG
jgi:hypothetical protein